MQSKHVKPLEKLMLFVERKLAAPQIVSVLD
jgi:hypothetical protein